MLPGQHTPSILSTEKFLFFVFFFFRNKQTLNAYTVSCCLTSVSIITPSSCRTWVRKNVSFFWTIETRDSKDDKYHIGFLWSRSFKDDMIAISSLLKKTSEIIVFKLYEILACYLTFFTRQITTTLYLVALIVYMIWIGFLALRCRTSGNYSLSVLYMWYNHRVSNWRISLFWGRLKKKFFHAARTVLARSPLQLKVHARSSPICVWFW